MKVIGFIDCYSHEFNTYAMVRMLCKQLGENVITLPLGHAEGQPFHLQLLIVEYEHSASNPLISPLSHSEEN